MTDREKFEAWFSAERKELIERKVGIPTLAAIADANWKVWRAAWQAAIASQQPADDGWIEWAGGDCPVGENAWVEIKTPYFTSGNLVASMIPWVNVIAYRVVKP